jgi:hypothetical protein
VLFSNWVGKYGQKGLFMTAEQLFPLLLAADFVFAKTLLGDMGVLLGEADSPLPLLVVGEALAQSDDVPASTVVLLLLLSSSLLIFSG